MERKEKAGERRQCSGDLDGSREGLRTRSVYTVAGAVGVPDPTQPPTQFGEILASPFHSPGSVSSPVKWA